MNAVSHLDQVSALMLASREGHKGVVIDLIEAGSDASFVSSSGWSALLFASAAGRRDRDASGQTRRSGSAGSETVASANVGDPRAYRPTPLIG